MMDVRYNKRTQEDEPYVGVGDATPFEYLDRLDLQNITFEDDIQLEGCAIEEDGLAIITSQPVIKGRAPRPEEILAVGARMGFERIPGIPANSEDCFSFYRRRDKVAAFDAHAGNFVVIGSGLVIPIDLVMVRADDAMHDYLCRRIDGAKQ